MNEPRKIFASDEERVWLTLQGHKLIRLFKTVEYRLADGSYRSDNFITDYPTDVLIEKLSQ